MNKSKQALLQIKAFGMTNQLLQDDLSKIEERFSVKFGHLTNEEKLVEDIYYPQFDIETRNEAKSMSKHYEIFYCLEKTIRSLVSDTLQTAEKTEDWWDSERIQPHIKTEVANRITKEADAAITRRSTDELDYTTFGELSQIITVNWDLFGSIFGNNKKGLEKVLSNLNSLRNPIAHCSVLAEDEELRLQLAVRDWFRLMEGQI